MRPQRNQQWVITEQENGSYDVWRGRQQLVTGLQALTSAKSIVSQHRRVHERVWVAEPDGYRTEITRQFKARQRPARAGIPEVDPNDSTPARTRYLAKFGRSSRPGRWI